MENKTKKFQSNKVKKLKKNLFELMLTSSSHGLPSAFRTQRTLFKIMWIIMFTFSTVCGIYFCARSLISYLEYMHVTQVDVIHEIPIEFPTVTFKSLNNPKNSLDDILINCYFNDDLCTVDDFEISANSNFKFNSGINKTGGIIPIKYTKQAGKETGLSLELFTGFLNSSQKVNRYNRFIGFYVSIHNYTIKPRNLDGFEVSTGFSTSFRITKNILSKLPSPFNDCYNDLTSIDSFNSFLYKFMLNSTKYAYRQKDCFDLCLSQELISTCDPTIELNYSDDLYNYYESNQELIKCFNKVWTEFFTRDVNTICSNYCPLECNSISFSTFTSFSKFPNIQYTNELLNNSKIKSKFPYNYSLTEDDIEKSVLSLNIYYEDMTYTKITQIPATNVPDLVSNLGGILGLFIGISFLSLGELVEIFFEIIFILFEKETNELNVNI